MTSAGGCFRPAPPDLNLAQAVPLAPALEVRPYIEAARCGRWIYERSELGPGTEPSITVYVRTATAGRLREGCLEPRSLPPIEQYIRRPSPRGTASRPADESPPTPLPAEEAPQLFEVAEPLAPIPLDLVREQPIVTTTEVRCYNRHGRSAGTGTLTRRARIEGTQDVECPAGFFADCLRVRVELRIEFPIGPTIDWDSYVWLSREVGEVRRIEDFTGKLWIFSFGSTHEYQLVAYQRDVPPSLPAELSPQWSRGVITLDRPIPRPRISGMVVDFATAKPEGDG